jgi:hypothetical protein
MAASGFGLLDSVAQPGAADTCLRAPTPVKRLLSTQQAVGSLFRLCVHVIKSPIPPNTMSGFLVARTFIARRAVHDSSVMVVREWMPCSSDTCTRASSADGVGVSSADSSSSCHATGVSVSWSAEGTSTAVPYEPRASQGRENV